MKHRNVKLSTEFMRQIGHRKKLKADVSSISPPLQGIKNVGL